MVMASQEQYKTAVYSTVQQKVEGALYVCIWR